MHGRYSPSEKTKIAFEVAGSQQDLNLFSNIDDGNNDGFAGRLELQQELIKTTDSLLVSGFGAIDYIDQQFTNMEGLYNPEFNRDWNLINSIGNQRYVVAGATISKPKVGNANYQLEHLGFSDNFTGIRHVLQGRFIKNKIQSATQASYLTSKSDTLNTTFLRAHNVTSYSFKKSWVGAKISIEDNQAKLLLENTKDSLTNISQRFKQYEAFAGVGDSTKVFVEARYQYRVTDSVRTSSLERFHTANTIGIRSKLLNTTQSQLGVFANYRHLDNKFAEDEDNLNARIQYTQGLFKNGIRLTSLLESNSGVTPQQDFTYVAVEPGQGVYVWNDYNNNGIQEIEEFEIAQFADEAAYIRILLPNRTFLKSRENGFSQSILLNPQAWINKEGILKVISKFYNQTSYAIERKVRRLNNGLQFNPFKDGDENQLGLSLNFRNVLFFNRGKQRYTTSYTYLNTGSSNLLSLGLQENKLTSHQIGFTHKVKSSWLFNLKGVLGSNKSTSENFSSRNFILDTYEIAPKVSYLLNKQTRFDVFYSFKNKDNTLSNTERLDQNEIGIGFAYANAEKISINGEFKYIKNDFIGNAFSPVAYQILEGLQPGTNFTWQLLAQKKITKYLDLNLSYNGRDSKTSKTIHTGSVQLRAYF